MLTASRLSLTLNHKVILNDIDFCLNSGELVALVGPNGAGKSSLFKALSGEYSELFDKVVLAGKPLSEWPLTDKAQCFAILAQQSLLSFPFKVAEVVSIGRTAKSCSAERNNEVVKQAMAEVDILHLADALYPHLSGGEKQRVHLARIFAQIWEQQNQQRYLLLDEPTAALDLAHQQQILQLAKAWSQQGVAVMAVLHDLNLAARFADRIVMLKQGSIFAQGNPTEVLTTEHVKQVFEVDMQVLPHPTAGYPILIPDERLP
ncbi:heme ABC transporter ATP-binding protein [Motilimonas pumila]|uniref:Heme ABC transporter ATP-binding protein n=1 Tax=Motilimonas pumila TaxID=2303987 RepID=A0A418YDX5_9GAMM|nr:heme ABC transporter ATP-binding protein [Motilimonas pumila]RJG42756.1 heme ABC transporter ATP-binding protein [Motilimonas pumila]